MKPNVRVATVDDLESILKLERECFAVPWSEKSIKNDLTNNQLATYFIAIVDENVVGYIGMWLVFEEAQITNLAVREKYRKNGIATQILQHLTNFAKLKGAIKITLEVSHINNPAIMFYKKHGFMEIHRRENYYGENGGDAIIMLKEI